MTPHVQFERKGRVLGSGRIPLQDGMTILLYQQETDVEMVLYGQKIGGEPQGRFPLFGTMAPGAYRVQMHKNYKWGFVQEPLPTQSGIVRLH